MTEVNRPNAQISFWEKMSSREKVIFIVGVIYLFSPIDFVPEALLGPIGLLDDGGVLLGLLRLLWNVHRRI